MPSPSEADRELAWAYALEVEDSFSVDHYLAGLAAGRASERERCLNLVENLSATKECGECDGCTCQRTAIAAAIRGATP